MKSEDVNNLITALPESWRHRWCESQMCGCMGGVNCSGKLTQSGVTYEDWVEWVRLNPSKDEVREIDIKLNDLFAKRIMPGISST